MEPVGAAAVDAIVAGRLVPIRVGGDRSPELKILCRELKSGRHNTGDLKILSVDLQCLAQDCTRCFKPASPEAVAQNNYAIPPRFFFRHKRPADAYGQSRDNDRAKARTLS